MIDILIPVFNEGKAINEVLHHIQKNMKTPHRFLICYDYDEDPTLKYIEYQKYPNLKLIKKGLF